MEPRRKNLVIYETVDGECPFDEWLEGLETSIVARIRARLNRVAAGNLGDAKPVGGAVSELRLKFGSGYRIYFANHGSEIIVLISGGDKGSQYRDIQTAKNYWQDFMRRNHA